MPPALPPDPLHNGHLLIVDDDRELCQLLSDYLQREGFHVHAVHDGRQLWAALDAQSPDLMLLDIMLPGDDGLTLCRQLRVHSRLPIIMLTAKGDDIDRILGLEMGADDYLPKPFNPRELLARIKSVLRRSQAAPVTGEVRYFHFAGWTLDVATRQLIDRTGLVIPLSSREYHLLRAFVDHPQRLLTRDQLIDWTQGREATPFDRSIDMQISRLRKRLGDDPRHPHLIKTLRNEGYLLATPVRREM